MRLYIPAIGDEIKLTADWTFQLHNESRNHTLMEFAKDPRDRHNYSYDDKLPCMLPILSVLKIDRIYIRKGLDDFSSITFFLKNCRTNPRVETETDWNGNNRIVKIPRKPIRFWVKLEDANTIEFEPT